MDMFMKLIYFQTGRSVGRLKVRPVSISQEAG